MKTAGWTAIGTIVVAAMLLAGGHARAQAVVVDGDLADLEAAAQGVRLDPANDVCVLGRSGFDFERVLVAYDAAEDALYLGLDLMDVVEGGPGVGLPGPGVPGDGDGDGDPNTGSNELCGAVDQPGVGPDEQYTLSIDVDADFDFSGPADLRIVYRGNLLRFEHGDGTPAPGVSGEIVLGVAGAPVDPLMPNENRLTEDIEIVVHSWSAIDPSPGTFVLDAFAGSLLDGLAEDYLARVLAVGPDAMTCRFGGVDVAAAGVPAPVITINGSIGDDARAVTVPVNASLEVFVDAPPAGPTPAPFVLYAWTGAPDETTVTPHPLHLGRMCFPSFLSGGAPLPAAVWNNVGREPILGTPTFPSQPAPSTPVSRPGGWPHALTATLQGIIADRGSVADRPGSLTNAVVLRIE